jgi:Amino acid synthesis
MRVENQTLKIRKFITEIEEVLSEEGQVSQTPLRKVAVTAVCQNPCAGRYTEDLSILIEVSGEVGNKIGTTAAWHMRESGIQSYGRARSSD